MKILPIVYPTAAEILLNNSILNNDEISFKKRKLISLPADYTLQYDAGQLENLIEDFRLSSPPVVYAPDKKHRVNRKLLKTDVRPRWLPNRSFIRLTDSIYIASPELCFLKAAGTLTFSQMIKFADDLCAVYVRDDDAEFGQRRREPITNADSIKKFVARSAKFPNVKIARRAIQYVLDGSGSPAETNIAVAMSLPVCEGGYKILRPMLNGEIKLSAAAARQVGFKIIHCDAFWPDQKVVLEYDSTMTHLSEEQHNMDKRRANALIIDGITEVVFTSDHMSTQVKRDEAFHMLMSALGMRINRKNLAKYYEKRKKVMSELYNFRF